MRVGNDLRIWGEKRGVLGSIVNRGWFWKKVCLECFLRIGVPRVLFWAWVSRGCFLALGGT